MRNELMIRNLSYQEAGALEASGSVIADVQGRRAIVTAGVSIPVTADPAAAAYYVMARAVGDLGRDIEAGSTREAPEDIRRLIATLPWPKWS